MERSGLVGLSRSASGWADPTMGRRVPPPSGLQSIKRTSGGNIS
jgi:hypothetical protein